MKTKYKYPITFLKFYKDFFEEDGFEWTLEEVNDKLIEDKNTKYNTMKKANLKATLKDTMITDTFIVTTLIG